MAKNCSTSRSFWGATSASGSTCPVRPTQGHAQDLLVGPLSSRISSTPTDARIRQPGNVASSSRMIASVWSPSSRACRRRSRIRAGSRPRRTARGPAGSRPTARRIRTCCGTRAGSPRRPRSSPGLDADRSPTGAWSCPKSCRRAPTSPRPGATDPAHVPSRPAPGAGHEPADGEPTGHRARRRAIAANPAPASGSASGAVVELFLWAGADPVAAGTRGRRPDGIAPLSSARGARHGATPSRGRPCRTVPAACSRSSSRRPAPGTGAGRTRRAVVDVAGGQQLDAASQLSARSPVRTRPQCGNGAQPLV